MNLSSIGVVWRKVSWQKKIRKLSVSSLEICKLCIIYQSRNSKEILSVKESECIPRYRILSIFINFNSDSLALYKMYFQNYFANRFIKLESLTSHLQHSRPCIRYTTFACCICWYNPAAHVINNTYITFYFQDNYSLLVRVLVRAFVLLRWKKWDTIRCKYGIKIV